jgi:hypothetical protein
MQVAALATKDRKKRAADRSRHEAERAGDKQAEHRALIGAWREDHRAEEPRGEARRSQPASPLQRESCYAQGWSLPLVGGRVRQAPGCLKLESKMLRT